MIRVLSGSRGVFAFLESRYTFTFRALAVIFAQIWPMFPYLVTGFGVSETRLLAAGVKIAIRSTKIGGVYGEMSLFLVVLLSTQSQCIRWILGKNRPIMVNFPTNLDPILWFSRLEKRVSFSGTGITAGIRSMTGSCQAWTSLLLNGKKHWVPFVLHHYIQNGWVTFLEKPFI